VNAILGTDLSTETIKSILQRLQFPITQQSRQGMTVAIPPYREDISGEIDLIEELARLYGYNNIPLTMPESGAKAERKTPLQKLIQTCLEVMTGCGLTQVINYSFINPQHIQRLGLPPYHPWCRYIRLANPLSEEQSVMRTTLIPGMLNTALKNFNRQVTNLGIFEIGRIYLPSHDPGRLPEEREMLTALISGKHSPGWKWAEQDLDFFLLKGVAQTLIHQVARCEPEFIPLTDHPVYHPGRSAKILVDHIRLGEIGELHPDVQDSFDLKQRVCLLNLDLNTLEQFSAKAHRYRPLARFPSVDRDMAVVVPELVSAGEIGAIIENVGGEMLAKYELFDVYRGPQVPEGCKSLAYSLTYQSPERTLTDEEVNARHEKIKEALRQYLQADFR
ncbi:MAG: phenylalanine--tRNA ligase subunit beta, partial [Clostridia bacterium]|nr:phenylalanine--tRNA ligase subunit beta [Clostridia bacterium]